jgi:F-type H+-transporting ATPase subunit O
MQKEVEATIGLFLQKGEKSKVGYKVDPAIMGGMVVSIGDKYADMSIATKMKKYTEIIQAAA